MSHYSSEKQTSVLKIKRVNISLLDNELEFDTGSGVFSRGRVDKGTKLLIEGVFVKGDKILDLGCGYGAIGISIAKAHSKKKVVMSDVNRRALFLTEKNIELNKLENCDVIYSDIYTNISGKFDLILSNLPQKAGKKVCFAMIEGAKAHLNEFGMLAIVGRHNVGGRSLEKKMKEVFGTVEALAKSGGYRVYMIQNQVL